MLAVTFAAVGECPVVKTNHQFLFEQYQVPFESCHASTIAQMDNGDLVAAWFGGSYEGCEDVCIWVRSKIEVLTQKFPGGSMVKNSPANAGDMGSIPGPGRSCMPQSS